MKCRSCGSTKLIEILDLGNQYLSDFREDDSKPNKVPLVAVICEDCKLVQLTETAPSGEMYHDNYGFKSGISESIKIDLLENVTVALGFKPEAMTWLDIASNDGTLLSYVPDSIYTVGVDPIGFLCKEATEKADKIVNAFFDAELFAGYEPADGRKFYDKFDVITSISCFYDMDDPNKFVSDVVNVLGADGIWDIQQNYLLTTMELGAVDNFCHEHLEYYTLLSLEPLLERHGLEVIHATTSMVNGGSLRTIVAFKGKYPIQDSVEKIRAKEIDAKLDDVKTYLEFSEKAINNLDELRKLVDKIKAKGKKIAILAASTRGSTIWQAVGLTEKEIEYAVERNPAKVGKYFSAIGIRIISEGKFRELNPEYAIIGPWFFAEEIAEREMPYLRNGGTLIQPLPQLTLLKRQS